MEWSLEYNGRTELWKNDWRKTNENEEKTRKRKIEKGQNNFIVILHQFTYYACCALRQVFDNPIRSRRDWGWQPRRSNLKTYKGVNRASKRVSAIIYRRLRIESQPKRGRSHWARHRDLHGRSDHVLVRSVHLWTSHLVWSQHSKLEDTTGESREEEDGHGYLTGRDDSRVDGEETSESNKKRIHGFFQ